MCQASHDSSPSVSSKQLSTAAKALVPSHPAAQAARDWAVSSLPTSIFFHSFRVYLYAQAFMASAGRTGTLSPVEDVSIESHVLFVACMLHDISTTETYDVVPERFEVVSADETARLLRQHGENEEAVREAWLAVTLHTIPSIPERLPGAIGALRLAILAEFGAIDVPDMLVGEHGMSVIRDELPRLGIEKELGDAVVRQACKTPSKAPKVSWAGLMLSAHERDPESGDVNRSFGDCA